MATPILDDDRTDDYVRNGSLKELADALKDHRSRAVDVVAPMDSMMFRDGNLVIQGVDPVIRDEGVTDVNGLYKLTGIARRGLASSLDIPGRYISRLYASHLPLLDHNVNEWFGHESNRGRKNLYRLLVNPVGDPGTDGLDGVVRAMLSDSYRTIDNFDILMATLHGMRTAGIEDPIISADLTETRMVMRVTVPGVAIHAPELLKDYRNPFGSGERVLPGWTPERLARAAGIEGMGYEPGTEPVLFAGFVISNSETGGGAFRITPRLEVRICRNGLTIVADATKEIHLGGKLDSGVIEWSEATRQASIQLVMNQTADVVRRFISPEYVAKQADKMAEKAATPVKPSDALDVIATVAKQTLWSATEQKDILDFFMEGGQFTAGGIMQAVTAASQMLPGDQAFDLDNSAVKALSLAATAGRRLVSGDNAG